MQNVRFLWASDEINAHAEEYWSLVMDVARVNNLARIQRCCTIMGRKDTEEMSAAQIFYPCMQCADVFFLKVSVARAVCVYFIFLRTGVSLSVQFLYVCFVGETRLTSRLYQVLCSNLVLCSLSFQQADICQLGMDQRKVNMLAR